MYDDEEKTVQAEAALPSAAPLNDVPFKHFLTRTTPTIIQIEGNREKKRTHTQDKAPKLTIFVTNFLSTVYFRLARLYVLAGNGGTSSQNE